MKINSDHFLDLADLLSTNLCLGENEAQTFLNGKTGGIDCSQKPCG